MTGNIGDQLAERWQAFRRGGVRISGSFPSGHWAEASIASLLLSHACSILAGWFKIASALPLTGCLWPS